MIDVIVDLEYFVDLLVDFDVNVIVEFDYLDDLFDLNVFVDQLKDWNLCLIEHDNLDDLYY